MKIQSNDVKYYESTVRLLSRKCLLILLLAFEQTVDFQFVNLETKK